MNPWDNFANLNINNNKKDKLFEIIKNKIDIIDSKDEYYYKLEEIEKYLNYNEKYSTENILIDNQKIDKIYDFCNKNIEFEFDNILKFSTNNQYELSCLLEFLQFENPSKLSQIDIKIEDINRILDKKIIKINNILKHLFK